ncbi:unnamed protein product [Ambrosiozyma monospora]|uniref:Unnamed protein product n=1 Tax=Ambrosiozyma monospora TaxID=43982 RepID=A0A9W6Z0A6_AMBMO|nr:unnamed protein product [Ambrosiozyma monospora]
MSNIIASIQRKCYPTFVVSGLGFLEYAYCYVFCYTKLYKKLNHESTAIALIIISNFFILLLLFNWALIHIVGPGKVGISVPPYDLDPYFKAGKRLSKLEKKAKKLVEVYNQDHNENETQTDKLENEGSQFDSTNPKGISNPFSDADSSTLKPLAPAGKVNDNDTDSDSDEEDDNDDDSYDTQEYVTPPSIFQCNKDGLPQWCSHCKSIKVLRSHHSSKLQTCVPKMDHYFCKLAVELDC